MKVVIREEAADDLDGIFAWIARDNPTAARETIARVRASIERLANFPNMARVGRVEGTREWVVPRLPYIVVYKVDEQRDELVVLAVFHGARDR